MRILHIYKDYFPVLGGIENHIRQLAEAQTAAGHNVTVLVTNPNQQSKQEQLNGVHVVRAWRLATIASTPLSPSLPLATRRLAADVVHVHSPYPLGELSQWGLGRSRPYVIGYHSDVIKQQGILRFYRPLLKRVLAGAGQIIVGSDNYVNSSPFLRPLANKCAIVPYAVDVARFAGARPLVPPANVPTLLFIGQHRYYKGVDDLIRVMPQLEARLLIGGDGPKRAEWENLAQQLGVAHKVQFLGRIPDEDLSGFYASGDIFVLPSNSRAESFGLVLQEAMAAARPCVTTELGTGTSWLVQHDVTGLVVPPENPAALAAALASLLADPDKRRQMGHAGQQRAGAEFTVTEMAARTEAIYQEVIGNL
ncbi:MAG: glycosyltransferase [Chloroflexi bacterium]|nr:glycosyltransferase [Ardenticatenaceae bacterium]MBL1129660.1 glycosyltransferase [Chloroflexota bacterium]NOG35740.1 glycosyltransferase [Chloroflexota bacterium]GIK56432.1 MAG: glycosyl transferase family 1 [Chloroflexota bacterium]